MTAHAAAWRTIAPDASYFVLVRPDDTWHLFAGGYEPSLDDAYRDHSVALRPLRSPGKRQPHKSLIVFVSEACNLRCDYCKVGEMIDAPRKSAADPTAIARSIVRAATDAKGRIDVIFYGGEPLLAAEAIDQICTLVRQEAPRDHIAFSMTTNGTLLNDRIVEILLRHDINVAVSLDGGAATHDRHRRNVGGRNTHERVVANYRRMKESALRCGPIAVVTDPLALEDMFRFFVDEFDDRSIYLKPLEVRGDESPAALKFYYDNYITAQLALLARCLKTYRDLGQRLVETRTMALLRTILYSGDADVRGCHTSAADFRCSIGGEIEGIEATGEHLACPNIKKYRRRDDAFIEALSTRAGYCDGCAYRVLCPAFCLAEMDEDFVEDFIITGRSPLIDVVCGANKKFIDGVFDLFREARSVLYEYARPA